MPTTSRRIKKMTFIFFSAPRALPYALLRRVRPAVAGDISCQLLAVKVVASGDTAKTQHEDDEISVTKKMASLAADVDWGRCARFALLGTVLVAPALHYWYGFLHRQLPGTAATTVVKRVALDQLGFAPAFIAIFLSSVMVLDGNAAKVNGGI